MSAAGGAVGGSCVGTSPSSLTAGATALNFSGITIPALSSCAVTFSVISTTTGANPNTTSLVTTAQTTTGSASNTAILTVLSAPVLTITQTHNGNFTLGEIGATYTITVTNSGTAPTSGSVTVQEGLPLPAGLTTTALAGTGWACSLTRCVRNDVLPAGSSYPAITMTVNVAANAGSPQVTSVSVTGGGAAATASAQDSAPIVAPPPPTADFVGPNSGTGFTPQPFVFQYSSASGFGYLNYVYGLFNTTPTAANGCYFVYTPSSNLFYLYNNAGTNLIGPLTPGDPVNSIFNSQCTLKGLGSSASGSGNSLTVSVNLSFSGTFTNPQNIYGYAVDLGNAQGGFQNLGTWTP